MTKLVGVAGYARAGKDEVGKALARRGFEVTRFSQVLKDEVRKNFPRTLDAIAGLQGLLPDFKTSETWSPETFRRWLVEEAKPAGIRELLQEYGTEVRRGDDPEYWVSAWQRQAEKMLRSGSVCVVDVRFENEAAAVRSLGGEVWRVHRPGTGPVNSHASDRQDFPVDAGINNVGTLEQLDAVVDFLLSATR